MGGINMYLYKPSNMGWFILVLTTIHCNTLQYIAIHYIHIYNCTYILMYTWCIHVIIHQKASRVQVQLAGWRYPIPWLAGRPCISCISCVYLCLLLTERYCNAICYVFYWLIQLLPMSLLLVTAHCCWYPPLATRSCHSYMWYMSLKDTQYTHDFGVCCICLVWHSCCCHRCTVPTMVE
jgi:hypothetical protein